MAFEFGLSSNSCEPAETENMECGRAEQLMMPPAIKLSSLQEMCETGGITFIILIVLVVVFVYLKYVLGVKDDPNRPNPLGEDHGTIGRFLQRRIQARAAECGGLISYGVIERYLLVFASLLLLKVRGSAHPLYDYDMENLSTFRKFIMVPLEHIFVLPFVPRNISSLIMWVSVSFFTITSLMAVTRYYESKWAHDVIVLQGPLNMISHMLGCNSLNLTAVVYSEAVGVLPHLFQLPPKSDKWRRMDYFFSYHLCVGLIWLVVGSVQIYHAKEGAWSRTRALNWKAHRIFGWFAIFFLVLHIAMMAAMTIENPVNQHQVILIGYVGMVYRAIANLSKGIKHGRLARIKNAKMAEGGGSERRDKDKDKDEDKDKDKDEENRQKHKMYMFFVYVRTTMGSGSIRIGAWALWLVGHFMSPETRVLFDRGACQTYAEQGIGDATDCWRPVFVNMLFTDLIVVWLELLFLAIPNNIDLAAERNMKRGAFEQQVIIIVPSIYLVWKDLDIERWSESSSLPYFIVQVLRNLSEFDAFIWYFVVHYSDEIREMLQLVHRPIVREGLIARAYTNAIFGMRRMYRLHQEEEQDLLEQPQELRRMYSLLQERQEEEQNWLRESQDLLKESQEFVPDLGTSVLFVFGITANFVSRYSGYDPAFVLGVNSTLLLVSIIRTSERDLELQELQSAIWVRLILFILCVLIIMT